MLLHVLDREEVTADVDQGTAVLEAGFVLDGDRRDAPVCRLDEARGFDLGRQELQQALHPVVEACARAAYDLDPAGAALELVALVPKL